MVALIRPSAWKLGLIITFKFKEEVPMQASLLSLGAKPPLTSHEIRVKSLYTPTSFNDPTDSTSMAAIPAPKWAQKTITLPPQRRGCHHITPKVSSSQPFSFLSLFLLWIEKPLLQSIWNSTSLDFRILILIHSIQFPNFIATEFPKFCLGSASTCY